MKFLLTIFLLFTSTFLIGQSELQSCDLDSLNFDMIDIEKSKFKVNIRINLKGQIIDLFSNDSTNFVGILTNEITEYKTIIIDKSESQEANKIIFQKVILDSITSSFLAKQIINSRLDTIPTSSLIPSWNNFFFHCDGISFEFKIDDKYSSKSYVCPLRQPVSIEYSEIIKEYYKLIRDTLKLNKKYDEFVGLLEGGKYYSTVGYMFIYKFTKSENESLLKDKPRRDYLESLKDTIDSYLSTELEKYGNKLIEIESSFSYNLIFNKRGKLKSIKVPEYQKPKLLDDLGYYIEDIIEINKCKREIKRIFKNIDLSSFDLKYDLYRTISLYDDSIKVLDNMIY